MAQGDEERAPLISGDDAESSFTNGKLVRELMSLTLPMALNCLCWFGVTFALLSLVGQLGVQYLAGTGLAITTLNFFGLSIIQGLVGGLDTLLAQAFGMSTTHRMISIYCQRAVAVLL